MWPCPFLLNEEDGSYDYKLFIMIIMIMIIIMMMMMMISIAQGAQREKGER
mgnify:CR=1 FL=1